MFQTRIHQVPYGFVKSSGGILSKEFWRIYLSEFFLMPEWKNADQKVSWFWFFNKQALY